MMPTEAWLAAAFIAFLLLCYALRNRYGWARIVIDLMFGKEKK